MEAWLPGAREVKDSPAPSRPPPARLLRRESFREEPGVPQSSSSMLDRQLDLQLPDTLPGPISEQGPPSMAGGKYLQGSCPSKAGWTWFREGTGGSPS